MMWISPITSPRPSSAGSTAGWRCSNWRAWPLKFLEEKPGEIDELYDDILIRVTSFFRDRKVFEYLQREIFPELAARSAESKPVRIWVPGCASGEEVYSLAMTLCDLTKARKAAMPVQLFGTDVSEAAIEVARAGRLPGEHRGRCASRQAPALLSEAGRAISSQRIDSRELRLRPPEPDQGSPFLEAGPDQLPQRSDLPRHGVAAESALDFSLRSQPRRVPPAGDRGDCRQIRRFLHHGRSKEQSVPEARGRSTPAGPDHLLQALGSRTGDPPPASRDRTGGASVPRGRSHSAQQLRSPGRAGQRRAEDPAIPWAHRSLPRTGSRKRGVRPAQDGQTGVAGGAAQGR